MRKVILYLFLLSLCSCAWFDYTSDHLTGNYYIVAIDGQDNTSVCYSLDKKDSGGYLGIVNKGVYEAGFDEHYIIAKKYKYQTDSLGFHGKLDKTVTEYYIVPVDNTQEAWEAQENCFGPLTKQEFEAKRKELRVSDSIVFRKI